MLAPESLVMTYKRLDGLYQKVLSGPEDIDERSFIMQRTILSPSRFTPFGGRVTVAVNKNKQILNSQKILSYEENDETIIKSNIKNKDVVVDSNNKTRIERMFKPLASNKPLNTFSTPMSQAMEMYNWVA